MGNYRIKYNYDTGDSLNNECGLEDYIELDFDDIVVAKENLKRIEAHYKQYEAIESFYSRNDTQKIIEENQNKDWFVKVEKPCIFYKENRKRTYQAIDKERIEYYKKKGKEVGTFIDSSSATHSIILYTDMGKPFQFHCPWCGYFETLNFVEIVENISDRRIEF